MLMIKKIQRCRVSGSENLISVLNLGEQSLTGVFPRSIKEKITTGPLELLWCPDSGLLQLAHSYDSSEMYGMNYGYRSGLNKSMIDHLNAKASYLEKYVSIQSGDVVLDIGSNDATYLKSYQTTNIKRIGIDPTGIKFKDYYADDIELLPDFFSLQNFKKVSNKKAKIITSIAMFYDLEDPIKFAREVSECLSSDGIWHLEQSYMPLMLELNSYDTICHEHIEYYHLGVIKKILDAADLKILEVEMNDINGGSFAVTATHKNNNLKSNIKTIESILEKEYNIGINTIKPYEQFNNRVFEHKKELKTLLKRLKEEGKRVLGYGASTKGNTILQFCGIGSDLIQGIAEVNPDKFDCYTPGTHIPIISEKEARSMNPDYFLVLPWHFKKGIVIREKEYLDKGGKMIFPFPSIEIV